MTVRVGDWVAALDALYDPAWAEEWDAVGLVCGDLDAPASAALLAIDPVAATVDEAVRLGAGLLVTHHPLLLRPVHGLGGYKGRLVERLLANGVALYVAHTNADVASPGVSDALAAALGVVGTRPLAPSPPDPGTKLVTYVPPDAADRLVDALAAAGAGVIGDYTRCAWLGTGTGTYVAGATARPAIGAPGARSDVPEVRVEMVVGDVTAAVAALRAAHPYEEPAYDVVPTLVPNSRGAGRVGRLAEPMSFDALADRVRAALPAAQPIRAGGDPDRTVETIALCGGAGDDLIDAAIAAGADAYVTADLRHHPASEARERGLALIDAGHWASEWPWLPEAAARLAERVGVVPVVSVLGTDPWS